MPSFARSLKMLAPFVAFAMAPVACQGADALPPYGEVEVVIDTDMPVPRLVSRVRVDVYTDDRKWIQSRDFLRATPGDWPTSFVVASPDADRGGALLVRMRAYHDGQLREYLGERFFTLPSGNPGAPAPFADGDGNPRLLDASGRDITPDTEPLPLVTVDRLVRVLVTPGRKERMRVLLSGACTGIMVDMSTETTCVDDPRARVSPVMEQTPRTTGDLGASAVGSFGPAPCTLPTLDHEVCVPGDVFVLGGEDIGGGIPAALSIPGRMARVPAFRIDRNEVTVARWREAVRAGFTPPPSSAITNDAPLPASISADDHAMCTYTSTPMGRENYPMNCVSWDASRAFCKFIGGDLPLGVEWAYVATAALRAEATPYPWGGSEGVAPPRAEATPYPWGGSEVVAPPCARGVFGRDDPREDGTTSDACLAEGFGPQPVDARIGPQEDFSVGLGIVNLGGSVMEWMRDDLDGFDTICWMRNGLDLPSCIDPSAVNKEIRGGGWTRAPIASLATDRNYRKGILWLYDTGFRCVREAP